MKRIALSNRVLKIILFLTTGVIFTFSAHSGETLYSDLQMKNHDEMMALVKIKIQKAEKMAPTDIEAAKSMLQDALQLIVSRPNPDNMVSQLIPNVRTPLKNIEAYDSAIFDITNEAINTAKNKKATVKEIATAYVQIENILSEMKPDIATNAAAKKIVEMIRDADLQMPDSAKSELKRRSIANISNTPSVLAKRLLANPKKP